MFLFSKKGLLGNGQIAAVVVVVDLMMTHTFSARMTQTLILPGPLINRTFHR